MIEKLQDEQIIIPGLANYDFEVSEDSVKNITHITIFKYIDPLKSHEAILKQVFGVLSERNSYIPKIYDRPLTVREVSESGLIAEDVSVSENMQSELEFKATYDYYEVPENMIAQVSFKGSYGSKINKIHYNKSCSILGVDRTHGALELLTYGDADLFDLKFQQIDIYRTCKPKDIINPEVYKYIPIGFGSAKFDQISNVSQFSTIYFYNKDGDICRFSNHFLGPKNEYSNDCRYNIVYGVERPTSE